MDRETGYYWVYFSFWRIGMYYKNTKKWILMGMDLELENYHLTEIDENKIKNPHD